MAIVGRVPNVTHSQPPSLLTPWGATSSGSTDVEPTRPGYYKIRDVILTPLTEAQSPGDGESKEFTKEASQVTSEAERPVKGVVSELDGSHARVTLFYGGRDNDFLLDVRDLDVAGASYPGALFEIIIGTDYSYKIVHSGEEEAVARREAPPPDLSFLDGYE
ncbi:MAG: hypothetical protein ACRD2P_14610 [Terriglobia bacterium]